MEGEMSVAPGMREQVTRQESDQAISKMFSWKEGDGDLRGLTRAALELSGAQARALLEKAKKDKPNQMHTNEEARVYLCQDALEIVNGSRKGTEALEKWIGSVADETLFGAQKKRDEEYNRLPNYGFLGLGGKSTADEQRVNGAFDLVKDNLKRVTAEIVKHGSEWAAK